MNFERTFFEHRTGALISSAKRSQQDRQRDVFDSHRHRVFALAYYMVGNEVDAEEALKQTFLGAFQSTLEPDAKCVDTSLIDELRRRVPLDEQVPFFEAGPKDALGNRNVRRTEMEEAIGELPAAERIVFLLKDVEGYSCEAIAELMQLPIKDLHKTLLSSRLRLRSALAEARIATKFSDGTLHNETADASSIEAPPAEFEAA